MRHRHVAGGDASSDLRDGRSQHRADRQQRSGDVEVTPADEGRLERTGVAMIAVIDGLVVMAVWRLDHMPMDFVLAGTGRVDVRRRQNSGRRCQCKRAERNADANEASLRHVR